MAVNRILGATYSAAPSQRSSHTGQNLVSTTQPNDKASHAQFNGPADFHPRALPAISKNGFSQPPVPRSHPHHQLQGHRQHYASNSANLQVGPRQQNHITENAVADLLPYCTTGRPLLQEQVIALSDVAGSLKELMILALGAVAGDAGCANKLEGAVGRGTGRNIVEFFVDEWEME